MKIRLVTMILTSPGWVVLAGLAAAILFFPIPGQATGSAERTFRIEASQFAYSPAEIKVNPGDRVTIELVAKDVVHGLAIDGYPIQTTADPGQPGRITFIADKPGTFRMRCTVTCGNLHPFMIGKLHVGQNMLFLRGMVLAALVTAFGAWRGRAWTA